jgi:hypothetical protein
MLGEVPWLQALVTIRSSLSRRLNAAFAAQVVDVAGSQQLEGCFHI